MSNVEADNGHDAFDDWSIRYHLFYPEGSRADVEFRTTRLLVLAGRAWINMIDRKLLREIGQSRARFQVLFAIAFAPQPATLTDISRRAHMQWPSLVRLVEGMAREGLLCREDNPADGRSKLISLTPEGEAMVKQIQAIKDRERSTILHDLTDDELQQGVKILQRIFESLERNGAR